MEKKFKLEYLHSLEYLEELENIKKNIEGFYPCTIKRGDGGFFYFYLNDIPYMIRRHYLKGFELIHTDSLFNLYIKDKKHPKTFENVNKKNIDRWLKFMEENFKEFEKQKVKEKTLKFMCSKCNKTTETNEYHLIDMGVKYEEATYPCECGRKTGFMRIKSSFFENRSDGWDSAVVTVSPGRFSLVPQFKN